MPEYRYRALAAECYLDGDKVRFRAHELVWANDDWIALNQVHSPAELGYRGQAEFADDDAVEQAASSWFDFSQLVSSENVRRANAGEDALLRADDKQQAIESAERLNEALPDEQAAHLS